MSAEAHCVSFSGPCHHHSVAGQDIVGERKPMQHRVCFVTSSNRELIQSPLSEASVDAFSHAAPLEDCLAVRALHALAPGRNTRSVLAARRVGIGFVLAVHRRTIDLHARRRCPFGIVILVEATVDKMALGLPVVAALKLFERFRAAP